MLFTEMSSINTSTQFQSQGAIYQWLAHINLRRFVATIGCW